MTVEHNCSHCGEPVILTKDVDSIITSSPLKKDHNRDTLYFCNIEHMDKHHNENYIKMYGKRGHWYWDFKPDERPDK